MINLNEYRENIYHKYGIRECPHYGEDGVILKIFDEIGSSKKPHCVEFGELRVLGTTTRSFRIKYKARSLYFSGSYDFKSFYLNILDIFKIISITKSLGYLKFFLNFPFKQFVTTENIVNILYKNKVDKKNLDIMTIDLDSYDYYIIKKVLESGFRPKLFIAEYNPSYGLERKCTFPNDLDFTTDNKRSYGASYSLLDSLFKQNEYKLCFVSGFCNLFYIRNDLASQFITPNIQEEITDTNEKVLLYIERFCQKGFIPSWFNERQLSQLDFDSLDELEDI